MKNYKLALIGFGNVGKAFARLLLRKETLLREQFDTACTVTGIATGHHGIAVDPAGIDLEQALSMADTGGLVSLLSSRPGRKACWASSISAVQTSCLRILP